jgi:hypothetical protein
MSTESIHSEEYVRGRIYSYLKFHKYLKSIAKIVCEEWEFEYDTMLGVELSEDGKIVWMHFEVNDIGFDSDLLWDKNIRETLKKDFESD